MKTPPKATPRKHWYLYGPENCLTLVCVKKFSWKNAEFLSKALFRTSSCITFTRVPAVNAYALLRKGTVSRGFSAVHPEIIHILELHNVKVKFGGGLRE